MDRYYYEYVDQDYRILDADAVAVVCIICTNHGLGWYEIENNGSGDII